MMKYFAVVFGVTTIWGVSGLAASQTTIAKLEIKVIKKAYGDEVPKPFVGVGVFDILRGRVKLEGAQCPDKSGASGGMNCSIPCQANQDTPITIRIKPPSDQDHLAGWVTPAAQDIELRGCKLTPQLVTMKYDDAKYALNELIVNKYAANGTPITNMPDHWVGLFKTNPVLATRVAVGATASAKGRGDLVDIYRFAGEGAKAFDSGSNKLTSVEVEESRALAKWQILSTSALLKAKLTKTIPESQLGVMKFDATVDLSSYLANLSKADTLLSEIKDKTPEQLKLADDIKTLRAMPVTGKNAQTALPILEQWK